MTGTKTGSIPSILGLLLAITFTFSAHAKAPEKTAGKKKAAPKVGDVAPDFKLMGSDGKTYKLSDFKGKSGVVIAWYPMAMTPG